MFKRKIEIRLISMVTIFFFLVSTLGVYAQQVPGSIQTPQPQAPQAPQAIDISKITAGLSGNPEISALQGNIANLESALRQIDQTARPLYNKIAPSNMEALSIGERIKAIVGNTKSLVNEGVQSYKGQVNDWNAANGITPKTSFEEELGVGLKQLGVETGKMPLNGNGNLVVGKLKTIINAIKDKIQTIIAFIRAKIVALAQKIGLMKKTDESKTPKKDQEGVLLSQEPGVQHADTLSAKLSKGVSEGAKNAKQSLKNSFSITNLAVTTTVAVGTNLALQMIKGERPSFGKAAKAVASVEFAGSVVGSALGAAGGQFASTLVKTFMPGPIGALVGAFVPVLTASFGGQMGSSLAGDVKRGQFSISKAFRQIDKVDLVGSSIGSTIGMALGAPIPIIGPIIGGIVGGVLGGKIAKWVVGFAKGQNRLGSIFNRGSRLQPQLPSGSGLTLGNFGGQNLGLNGPSTWPGGLTPVGDVGKSPATQEMDTVGKKYYETYLNYNKLVEQGKYDDAKKVYGDLKIYSDQYNSLKSQAKSGK